MISLKLSSSLRRTAAFSPPFRTLATAMEPSKPAGVAGNISDVFASLSGSDAAVLPLRFSTLKKELWDDRMIKCWTEVLTDLGERTKEISRVGPRVSLFALCVCLLLSLNPGFVVHPSSRIQRHSGQHCQSGDNR